MLEPSVNVVKTKADSRYTLVILAAKRARDIIDGKPQLLEEEMEKPVSAAAHEIAGDLITYTRPEEEEEEELAEEAEAL
ncbi:MAG: DNA-directed RNA polymerase subunit omega [Clostridiales bacterium]|nr:DNA-directed RNA polymerase subunit omega [Clostridiales bacterium]